MSRETVLRGPHAMDATVARFDVDLRAGEPAPTELTEHVRAAARATGYAEGWSEGHRAALRAARAAADKQEARARLAEQARADAMRRAVAAIAAAAGALERHTAVDIAALEDLVLRSAFQIAEAILDRELTAEAEPGGEALRRALSLVPPDGPVTVLLNPADYAALTGTDAPGYEQACAGRPVLLHPDPALASGDAIAECAATTVDARLAAAVQRVRAVLAP